MSKVVGIVCDDYKVEKFKKDLTAAKFTKYEVSVFNAKEQLSTIKVTVEDSEVKQLAKICQLVELHFKRSN